MIFLSWFLFALIGAAIGNRKGETGLGFFLGFLLGPLGLLIELIRDGDRMPCPFCKEKVHKDATICPFCRQPLPPKEEEPLQEKVPLPRGTEDKNGLLKALLVFTVLLLIAAVAQSLMKKPETESIPAPPAAVEHFNTVPSATKSWRYETHKDALTQKEVWTASLLSDDKLSLSFPYNGEQAATLAVRKHPQFGKGILFTVERGQIQCSIVDGCDVTIRFDERQPERFHASLPSDHSSNSLFIKNYETLVPKILKAKKTLIQVPFYQNGLQTLTFHTENLNIP